LPHLGAHYADAFNLLDEEKFPDREKIFGWEIERKIGRESDVDI
jgi:hypothetical protein